jgi:tRNA(Ile)-lysidine synthase
MTGPTPAVAAVRSAVRDALKSQHRELESQHGRIDPLVLVACSGGSDSLALAGATGFVAGRMGWRAGLVTVDHGLQDGSDKRAALVAQWAGATALDPVEIMTVDVGRAGGPEAAARTARYDALVAAAKRHHASTVLLGHTLDDQAETVLLALARGGGPRGLAGMPALRERDGVSFRRPLLRLSRATCRQACEELGLAPWDDPHNVDPSYARSRVRAELVPALVQSLGPGVIANLARSAELIAADTAYLDDVATSALRDAEVDPAALRAATVGPDAPVGPALSVHVLRALAAPVRTRVLRAWALSLGAVGSALSHRHIAALDALITDWHGQGPTQLPGGLAVARHEGLLRCDGIADPRPLTREH